MNHPQAQQASQVRAARRMWLATLRSAANVDIDYPGAGVLDRLCVQYGGEVCVALCLNDARRVRELAAAGRGLIAECVTALPEYANGERSMLEAAI